jgi:arabinose-5-phosphate isomerase
VDILAEARKVLEIEATSIKEVCDKLGAAFEEAIELLFGCRGKVVISGLGKSGLVGRKIASTLASTGTPAVFLHPAEGAHGDLGVLARGDVAVLISNSGETEELVKIISSIKRIGIKVLALVGNPESTLARDSDIFIDVGVSSEACPDNLVPTASTTALLSVGDALAVVLLKKRGFDREDFACLHPGGSIGRRLLLRVSDIMHSGEANSLVTESANMQAAIVEMTSKGLGAVSVVDDTGVLVGVITDGDLRRALARHGGKLLEKPVIEVMTGDPVTITGDRLAVEAVQLMENRPSQISVLPVIDANRRAVGLLRLHDLLQEGVI